MKRLLIAIFLLVISVTIYAITDRPVKKAVCPETKATCCLQKTNDRPAPVRNTNHIFWEPVSRLMMIP